MTISKALQKFLASGGKIQKLKPQKVKRHSSSGRSSEIADQNIPENSDEDVSLDTIKEEETEQSSKEETETSNS